jgi:predicted permease
MTLRRLGLWRSGAVNREIDEELRFHLDQLTAENVAAGMSRDDAAREARKRFGNIQSVREQCRDAKATGLIDDFWRDVRFGMRQLRRSPVFTVVAVASLGLGIGAATAIFALVHGVLLRSLPVPNPQELVVVRWSGTDPKIGNFMGSQDFDSAKHVTADAMSFPIFLRVRQEAAPVADVFGFTELPELGTTVQARHEPFAAAGLMVSDNLFSGLGVRPAIGRVLGPEDDAGGTGPAVVITYDWWLREFDLDPGVLGQALTLNGHAFTIVGVLPRGFPGLMAGSRTEFYVPMSAQPQLLPAWGLTSPDRWFVRLMARMKPGVSTAHAATTIDAAFRRDAETVMTQPRVLISEGQAGFSNDRQHYRRPLLLLLSIVGVVVLIACANLAGLLLARGATRQHEFAVRAAIGAGRWRLFRQSLTENALISLLGGALGVPIAVWGKTVISRLLAASPDGLRYDTSLDLTVLTFSLGAALLTAVVSGSLPALRAWSSEPLAGLKERSALASPRLRVGKVLVAAQVALSVLLLTGAGLYVRTLVNLVRVDPGFATDDVLLFKVSPRTAGLRGAKAVGFFDEAQRALAAIPGVRAVTFTQNALLSGSWSGGTFFTLPGQADRSEPQAYKHTVGDTFFATMGVPIVVGRELRASDTDGAPKVVVVNQEFTRRYLAGRSPLGQMLKVKGDPVDWQIVGVCQDTRYTGIRDSIPPTIYFSFRQDFISFASFAVRTSRPPLAIVPQVRRAVASVSPLVPLAGVTTQQEMRDASIAQERLFASLCGALAVLAVLLSCIGLYGLTAYTVARRTNEIGIRMALGASRAGVEWSVLREAALLTIVGVAVGLPITLVASGLVRSQLFGVPSTDPLTLAGSAALLFAVALFSAWIPGRRAARVDAMLALRCE